jgi:flagellar hook-length control protein FliK
MSAPAFAIPAVPFLGDAAAPKRGAATADADFAAIMDDAAPAEAPAKPAAPVSKGDTETAHAPVEDSAPEVVEAAPAVDETVVAMPAPLLAPAPPIVVEAEVVIAETVPAAPAAETPPAPSDDLAALAPTEAPAVAGGGAAADEQATAPGTVAPASTDAQAPSLAEAKAPADLPDLSTLSPEQPKAAPVAQPPAPLTASVAPPAPRPAKPVVEATAPTDITDEAPATAAPLEALAAPAEAPRTRDVIDRAVTHRADAQGASSAGVAPEAEATPFPDGAEPAPTAPAPRIAAVHPAALAEPAALTTPIADDAVVNAPVATTAQPVETRAADPALSLALSTASHASIETTAQIAAQIVKKLEGRSVRFEMALTPEGLGNVDVSLDIDADGKLIARMAFDNPLAATELRGRADELRRQLQDSGFTVADDALSFAERDASAGQHGGSAFDNRPDPRGARAFGAGARLSAEADIAVPGRWIPLTLTPDRVDMKV